MECLLRPSYSHVRSSAVVSGFGEREDQTVGSSRPDTMQARLMYGWGSLCMEENRSERAGDEEERERDSTPRKRTKISKHKI